jgi:hypothetical protein
MDLHLQSSLPQGFFDDGRLTIAPDNSVWRLVPPTVVGATPTFSAYQVAR